MMGVDLRRRRAFRGLGRCGAAVLLASVPVWGGARELFVQALGDRILLDGETAARVRGMPEGERFYLDRDGDGRPEEVWYIDTDARHPAEFRPLLVRVVDEDGDLVTGGEGDLDSDLYIADWKADGSIDAILDYEDGDGDGDLDAMVWYAHMPRDRYVGGESLWAVWGRDDGDDNLLFYDVGYTYRQEICQWRCHFGGDETLVIFSLSPGSDRWVSNWENPFLFFDPDRDGCSESVIRISGIGDMVETLRYSLDADNDGWRESPHDYDVSITAIAPGSRLLEGPSIPHGVSDIRLRRHERSTTRLRDLPTGPFLARARAADFARRAPWAVALLTWDEVDSNTRARAEVDPNERWEGILAPGFPGCPQVGGPCCSVVNKRFELDRDPGAGRGGRGETLRLYHLPADGRLHLFGAGEGWIDVDYDFDGLVDMKYRYRDTDGDGFFDLREVDLDGGGKYALSFRLDEEGIEPVRYSFESVHSVYPACLESAIRENRALIGLFKAVLAEAEGRAAPDAVEAFFRERLEGYLPAQGVGRKIRSSPEAWRFYGDLVRDRYYARVRARLGGGELGRRIERAYARGAYRAVASMIRESFPEAARRAAALAERCGSHRVRIPIELRNPVALRRDDALVTIPLAEIVARSRELRDSARFLLAASGGPEWRYVPFQIVSLDGRREFVFVASLGPGEKATYYLYGSPREKAKGPRFARRTAAAMDWLPENIGWESERIAYRSYSGQFDFFGKKIRELILSRVGSQPYHRETSWGMDVLLVGDTSGIGGLTLYDSGGAHPVRNPKGEGSVRFERRILAQGPVYTVIEIRATGVDSAGGRRSVRVRCSAVAGGKASEVRVRVSPQGAEEVLELAPGFTRLKRDAVFLDTALGVFGTWGLQTHEIGEIGMGLVFDPLRYGDLEELPEERRVRLKARGELRYLIVGDWRRGRRFPIAPGVENWRDEVCSLASRWRHPIRVRVGEAERVP